MGFWIKLSLFVIALLLLGFTFWRNRDALKGEAAVSLFAAIIFFAVPFIIDHVLPQPSDPDYFAKNKPYIEPVLKSDYEGTNGFYFFEIRNLGNLPADNLRMTLISDDVTGSSTDTRRELSPKGRMKYAPSWLRSAKIDAGNVVSLHIFYSCSIEGRQRFLSSEHRFIIEKLTTKNDETINEFSIRRESSTPFRTEDQFELMSLSEKFDCNTGTFMTWFKTPDEPNFEKMLLAASETKSLVYDPPTRMIELTHFRPDKTYATWVTAVETNRNGWHHVTIVWDEPEVQMYLDGNGPGRLPVLTPPQGKEGTY